MKILSKIRAFFILIEFSLTVAITIILMYLFNSKHRIIRKYWAKMQSFFIGYSIKIEGEIDNEAKIILINHQSLLDIVVLESFYPADLAWVAKKEIAKIPFFGHILKAPKMIQVDRESKKSIITLLKDVKNRIENQRVVAIFPEGTRGDGKNILPFKNGAKIVAENLALKVQPVVILNTREILDSKKFEAKSGEIKVIFLESILPHKGENWYENIYENMKKKLNDELANDINNR